LRISPLDVLWKSQEKMESTKVEKEKFEALLGKLPKPKPGPRKKVKTKGRCGPKPPSAVSRYRV
jgi:hypothetical protein